MVYLIPFNNFELISFSVMCEHFLLIPNLPLVTVWQNFIYYFMEIYPGSSQGFD